jgi:ubiquinone/menaquinone biosynthesis C-methylase UbiE
MSETPAHVAINRSAWTVTNATYTDAVARDQWAERQITWGVWHVPESELGALPPVEGRHVIELGCGTGYFGAWLRRAGAARVVGVDVTPAQLATARRCEAEFHLGMEFVEASAEAVPLPDASFDLAISEYGASIWCEPRAWIGEAARLLRPCGELVFLRNSTVAMLCMPEVGRVTTTLQRPQRDLARIEWGEDDPGVEFHPSTGQLVAVLRDSGFNVSHIIEVYAPDDAADHPYYDSIPAQWARRWPSEEIWRAQRVRGVSDAGFELEASPARM